MALDYRAYMVNPNGDIEHISTVMTQTGATELVKYWKKNNYWRKSFSSRNPSKEYKLKEKAYWEEYDRLFPPEKIEVDEYLPFQ